jgi:RNA polymerase-binding transcription factor DksA
MQLKTEDFREKLIARKDELTERLVRLESDLDAAASSDNAERAIERQDDEVFEALGEAGLVELRAIDAALDRMEHGRYGTCARCGDRISEARLNAVPHAALCQSCHAEINA